MQGEALVSGHPMAEGVGFFFHFFSTNFPKEESSNLPFLNGLFLLLHETSLSAH